MSDNVFVKNPLKVEKIKEAIKKDGILNLHILADFDGTLTKAFVDGKPTPSFLWILYSENYLTPDYPAKAQKLHDKYYKIEMDPSLPKEAKKRAMEEWWNLHFELLIKSKLNKKDIEAVIKSGKIKLRDGFGVFADILKENNIPLIILSSSGLGGEAIVDFLKLEDKNFNNIHIISNIFNWDKNRTALSVKKPIIHALNKDETSLQNFPEIYNKIKNKKNVLLLGNSPDDARMADGFDYINLIKVGFLNEKVEENLDDYKELYDIVITNDGPMDYVNKLLKEWCG